MMSPKEIGSNAAEIATGYTSSNNELKLARLIQCLAAHVEAMQADKQDSAEPRAEAPKDKTPERADKYLTQVCNVIQFYDDEAKRSAYVVITQSAQGLPTLRGLKTVLNSIIAKERADMREACAKVACGYNHASIASGTIADAIRALR